MTDPILLEKLDNGNGALGATGTKTYVDEGVDQSVQSRAERSPWGVEANPPILGGWTADGGFLIQVGGLIDKLPHWSIFPGQRDAALRRLARQEPIMAGALYSMVSRIQTLEWRIEGGGNRRRKYAQDLLGNMGFGKGWTAEIGKVIYDLLTQDNGAFLEIMGPGNPAGERVGPPIAVAHMDSAQCWRTFDPEYPVIYANPFTGTYHKLHHTRVETMSLNTMPNELARGIGFSALSRAALAVQFMRDVSIYKREKVTGQTRAIGIGKGFTRQGLLQALQARDEDGNSQGFVVFKGIPILLPPGAGPTIVDMDFKLVELASLPDNFNYRDDVEIYVNTLAIAFGVDTREFWPATVTGATKADATIQHLKAQGKGIGNLIQIVERCFNWSILQSDLTGVELKFDFTDDEQDKQEAELNQIKIASLNSMVQQGILEPAAARVFAVFWGVLDSNVLEEAMKQAEKERLENQKRMIENQRLMAQQGLKPQVDPLTGKVTGVLETQDEVDSESPKEAGEEHSESSEDTMGSDAPDDDEEETGKKGNEVVAPSITPF